VSPTASTGPLLEDPPNRALFLNSGDAAFARRASG
jgi:hypothetical protein